MAPCSMPDSRASSSRICDGDSLDKPPPPEAVLSWKCRNQYRACSVWASQSDASALFRSQGALPLPLKSEKPSPLKSMKIMTKKAKIYKVMSPHLTVCKGQLSCCFFFFGLSVLVDSTCRATSSLKFLSLCCIACDFLLFSTRIDRWDQLFCLLNGLPLPLRLMICDIHSSNSCALSAIVLTYTFWWHSQHFIGLLTCLWPFVFYLLILTLFSQCFWTDTIAVSSFVLTMMDLTSLLNSFIFNILMHVLSAEMWPCG